ncbi:translation initiation factor IF-6, partial [Candidatus Bathyarchaeota archaeon]|nr:translation initiation factor IF-6 [Candidatus Bathyarchaeota archaeon]
MPVYLCDIVGSASIGVYSLATDDMVIVPRLVPLKKAERIAEWLNVKLIHTSIGGSVLVGAFACANSNGILLPSLVMDEEINSIRSVFKGKIKVMETKRTAYGNMVLANDYGAAVDPRLKDKEIAIISETLGVAAVRSEIAGLPYVGSLGVATNKGVLVHPLIKDEERKILEDALKLFY